MLVGSEATVSPPARRSPGGHFDSDREVSHQLDYRFKIRIKRENHTDIVDTSMSAIHEVGSQVNIDALLAERAAGRSLQVARKHPHPWVGLPSRDLPPSCDISDCVLFGGRNAAIDTHLRQGSVSTLM